MNGKQQGTRFRSLISVGAAVLLGLLAHTTLTVLPAIATINPPILNDEGSTPMLQAPDDIFTITGTVYDQNGTPVSDVQVFAFSGAFTADVRTNDSGYFILELDKDNYYDIVFNPPLGTGLASEFRRGVHEGQEEHPLDVILPPGHSISGVVYADATLSNPVGNTEIFAFNTTTADGFGLPPTLTDGTYQISLAPGIWELTFIPPPFMGLGPVRITIEIGQDITRDIILQPGFTVYGQVTTSSGAGQTNVEIFAQDPSRLSGYGFTPTGPSGSYDGTLPLGNYDFSFLAPPFLGLGSTVVTNVSGPSDVELNLDLPAGHTVSGTVLCNGGVANAFVFAASYPPVVAGSFGGWGRFAGADGFYALALQPGMYDFIVVPPDTGGLPELTVPTVEVQEDLTLSFDLCVPTAVTLVSFKATASAHKVYISWKTASEIDNEGFNIWRSEAKSGTYTQLNTNLIPAQGDDTTGASYAYTDHTVTEGITYLYKLEDVDIHGVSTWHGPVSATPKRQIIFLPIVVK